MTGKWIAPLLFLLALGSAYPWREPCHARFAPAGQLDELVWRDLCEVLTHPAELARALERAHGGHWLPQALQARRENLRQGRVSLRQQIDRLTEAYLHDVIPLPEYERRRRDLQFAIALRPKRDNAG